MNDSPTEEGTEAGVTPIGQSVDRPYEVTAVPSTSIEFSRSGGGQSIGKTRNPWLVWLLSIITAGVYFWWWYYTINCELRDYDNSIQVDPSLSLLAVTLGLFVEIPAFVSFAYTGGRIKRAQFTAGSIHNCSALFGTLLSLFGFGTGVVYYQSQLNKVWDCYGNPDPTSAAAETSVDSQEFQALSHLCRTVQSELSARSKRISDAKKSLDVAGKAFNKEVAGIQSYVDDVQKSNAIAKVWGSVALYEDRIVVKGRSYPMTTDVSATVDTAGNISRTRRHTVTRFAALGPLSIFAPKAEKHDDRQLFLLVEGRDWADVVTMKPDHQKRARELAQAINLAARTSERAIADREERITDAREELEEARRNLGPIELAEKRLRESYDTDRVIESAESLRIALDVSPIKNSRIGLQAATLMRQAENALNESIQLPPRPSIASSPTELPPGES